MKYYIKLNLIIFASLLVFMACTKNDKAVPLNFGKDQCDFCKMTISNPKFGAELITDKGRVLKYDAAECMVNQLNKEKTKYQKLYAISFDDPKQLKEVSTLHFLISSDFRSPMGANLAAFSDTTKLDAKYKNQLISWEQLLKSL